MCVCVCVCVEREREKERERAISNNVQQSNNKSDNLTVIPVTMIHYFANVFILIVIIIGTAGIGVSLVVGDGGVSIHMDIFVGRERGGDCDTRCAVIATDAIATAQQLRTRKQSIKGPGSNTHTHTHTHTHTNGDERYEICGCVTHSLLLLLHLEQLFRHHLIAVQQLLQFLVLQVRRKAMYASWMQ